jgi:hypothetical protein
MAEFTASHFADLCSRGPVREQIETIETSRKAALGRFWLYLLAGFGGGGLLGVLVGGQIGAVLFVLALIAGGIAAWLPLSRASESIKHPVLHSLAEQGGMTFVPTNFDPPVFGEAHKPLFGSWLSSATFSDLFYGEDTDGRRFAVYEATLMRGHGKHRHQVFTGQIYAFQRRRRQQGAIVVVPDKGIFNFFKPAGGFERVKFEADPAFEKKFEVYADHPHEASLLFGDPALRQSLLQLRETSKRILVYVGPEDVLAAVWGKNRFEPGSMFRSRGGEERVRLMFDDVCASLTVLNGLKTYLS